MTIATWLYLAGVWACAVLINLWCLHRIRRLGRW